MVASFFNTHVYIMCFIMITKLLYHVFYYDFIIHCIYVAHGKVCTQFNICLVFLFFIS